MNRQTKRQMARHGGDRPRPPERRPASRSEERQRVGPGQFLAEVRGELKKVAWPDRPEVINSSLVVIVAVTVMTSLIFAFDWMSAHFVLFLFD